MRISIIQPSRNNLKYLKWSYQAIRQNQGDHIVEICIADDASTDGTWEWCRQILEEGDTHFKCIRNEGPERLGHTILYDRLVNEVASYDKCMIYHADMYLCPGALDAIEKHIGPKKIVSLTRIEPPLHPAGPEKLVHDFGTEPEVFDENGLICALATIEEEGFKSDTVGVFAPWAFMKSDFQEIGGHDSLYAPQSKEDSDIFNRFQLNDVQFIQTWQGFVYHMTCRGSRFNPTLTTPGTNSSEWEAQNVRSSRNFIRKWGHFVKHDALMKPVIPHKYNIAYVVSKNPTMQLIYDLEPWCDRLYIDEVLPEMIFEYQAFEQKNTKFDLSKRVFNTFNNDPEAENDIVVYIDKSNFGRDQFQALIQLPEIIEEQISEVTDPLQFDLVGMKVVVQNIATYENELIKINTQYNSK